MRRAIIIHPIVLTLCIVHFASYLAFAQQKYWISFSDKHGTSFNPYEYFDQRTIEQRLRWGIPLTDSTDFPVNEKYLSQVSALVNDTLHSSRWLNGVAVIAGDNQIEKVKKLPFVIEAETMEMSDFSLLEIRAYIETTGVGSGTCNSFV